MPLKMTCVIVYNPIAAAIPKWWTFKLLRWMQNLHQSIWGREELRLVIMVTTTFSSDS
jgi:hypothetical protein